MTRALARIKLIQNYYFNIPIYTISITVFAKSFIKNWQREKQMRLAATVDNDSHLLFKIGKLMRAPSDN